MRTLLWLWDHHCDATVISRRRIQLGSDSTLADRVLMYSFSTLDQSEQEIAPLAIEGYVIWTLETIESSITVDIKGVNPGFDIDTHVRVYDQEIKDIEADTQKTIKSHVSSLETLADVTEELTSAQGSGMFVHRQTIINTHESQTEFITQAVGEMNFCDDARLKLTEESQLLRQNWTGRKSEYWTVIGVIQMSLRSPRK